MKKTLILNIDMTPLNTVSFKRAVNLLENNRYITALIFYEDEAFHSEKRIFKIPAILLYSQYVNVPSRNKPTRKIILSRDRMICQYCKKQMNRQEATIDHIQPVSTFRKKYDANTWENMVGCCIPCNSRKGNRTPKQASMKLMKNPKPARGFIGADNYPKEWKEYI